MFLFVREEKNARKKIRIDTSMTGTKLADGRSPDGLKGGGGGREAILKSVGVSNFFGRPE